MRTLITIFFSLFGEFLLAQTTAGFENFNLNAGEYLNDSQSGSGFSSGHVNLPNEYDATFDFWSGWAISAVTDNATPGFLNQYSAIPGAGFDNSTAYAVAYAFDGAILKLEGAAAGGVVDGIYVTNSTYAYFSMLEGDAFSKKFGGESGNDPDFLLLTVRKYLDGQLGEDSLDFYLADYRFTDNSQDYIVEDWTYLDLSGLGNADSLRFTLTSTDVGTFGMNTPAYFCIDEVQTRDMAVAVRGIEAEALFEIFPNPASDFLLLDWKNGSTASLSVLDLSGKILLEGKLEQGRNGLEISNLSPGMYFLKIKNRQGENVQKFIKN